MSFDSLGLSAELLRAVAAQGYTCPTPVQTQTIPAILAAQDVLAGAQTGTGKTAAFVLPLLHRLAAGPSRRTPRALILTPTRELAAQVGDGVKAYGQYLTLRSTVIFGGVGFQPQVDAMRRGVDILVATPGRLLDHARQGTVDLSGVEILVLDEADRMLDMGFIHDLRKIVALLPRQRQTLMFSATYSDEIRKLADSWLNQPRVIEVARRNTAAETVEQLVHPVEKGRKRELLSHLIQNDAWNQVLVFTRTKHGANRLSAQLEKDGISAAAIHGNKSQNARTRALRDFKSGALRALVATDVASRGLDIDELPHVVNFELPNVPEDYVHRIGRTGRAGASGKALSLVSHDEFELLVGIQKLLRRDIPMLPVAGFEPHEPLSVKQAAPAAQPPTHGRPRDGARRAGRSASGGNGGRGNGDRNASGRSRGRSRRESAR